MIVEISEKTRLVSRKLVGEFNERPNLKIGAGTFSWHVYAAPTFVGTGQPGQVRSERSAKSEPGGHTIHRGSVS